MATDRLKIYNGALLVCSDQELKNLTVETEARRLLDLVWNDGGVRYCLEQAQWHFAMRASRFDYNSALAPGWGYPRAFDKPTDWVITSGVFEDDYLRTPLLQYADEASYWFSDRDVIYVKYVSDGASFGMDYSRWPSSFTDFVKAYFAARIIRKLPGGADKVEDITHPTKGVMARALMVAKNKSAMTQAVTFPNRGSWVAARHRGTGYNRDGGNTNSLIG